MYVLRVRARHQLKCFTCSISFLTISLGGRYCSISFLQISKQAQRGEVTCLKSHSKEHG